MEWIISAGINVVILVIWLLTRRCYTKEDWLVYLNTYELIETLKEPQRSIYLKASQRNLDLLFIGCLLAPWLGSLLWQLPSSALAMGLLVAYIVALIAYIIYADLKIQKTAKSSK